MCQYLHGDPRYFQEYHGTCPKIHCSTEKYHDFNMFLNRYHGYLVFQTCTAVLPYFWTYYGFWTSTIIVPWYSLNYLGVLCKYHGKWIR